MFVETTTENLRNLVFDLVSLEDGELVLEDNSGYIFIIHVNSFSTNNVFVPILGFNPNTSNNTIRWSYTAASDLAYDSIGVKLQYGTLTSQNATAVTDITDYDNRTYRTNSPFKMYTSVVFDEIVGTEDILAENQLSIYPNPTSDKLYVDMNLDKVSKNVRVEIYGMDGRRVLTDEGSLTKKVIVSK